MAGTPILPIYNQAAVFAPETPIFPSPRLIYTVQDGKEICQTLGDRTAMLLKGHAVWSRHNPGSAPVQHH